MLHVLRQEPRPETRLQAHWVASACPAKPTPVSGEHHAGKALSRLPLLCLSHLQINDAQPGKTCCLTQTTPLPVSGLEHKSLAEAATQIAADEREVTLHSSFTQCVDPCARCIQEGIADPLYPRICVGGDDAPIYTIVDGQQGAEWVQGQAQLPAVPTRADQARLHASWTAE